MCFPGGCQTTKLRGSNTMTEEKMALLDGRGSIELLNGSLLLQEVGMEWMASSDCMEKRLDSRRWGRG
jgi:hypothetical protein